MDFLKVGKIVKAHGLKGDVRVYPYTDDLNNLSKSKVFFVDKVEKKVEKISIQKDMLIVKFKEISNIDMTKNLINKDLYIEKKDINEDDIYYVEDLIGCEVYKTYEDTDKLEDYVLLGKITYVFSSGLNDVYEVKNDEKTILIPAVKQFIKKVDIKSKKVYVKMMEGLEDW